MTEVLSKRSRLDRISSLRRGRDRSFFLRGSSCLILVGIVWVWTTSSPLLGRLSAERRWTNFKNFVEELVPAPVRKTGDWAESLPWAAKLLAEDGFTATGITIGIATSAIILSGLLVLPLLPLASRKLARADPLGIQSGRRVSPISSLMWKIAGPLVRFGFVLCRSVPEYLLAFLLLSLLGLQVWPLVLALAIHNLGILGRLWSEVLENAEEAAPIQAAATGQGRFGIYATTMLPGAFNRFLIYFFYRWETCVKDATVLGMLGLLTLGKLIALSKGFFWDKMFFYIMIAASVIILGDLFSTWLRRRLR